MPNTIRRASSRTLRPARCARLVWLRCSPIFGQTIAVLVVRFLPRLPHAAHAGLGGDPGLGLLNIGLALRFPMSHRLSEPARGGRAGRRISPQLAVLLYLTGGLENPFAILFVAPVLISAMALRSGADVSRSASSRLCCRHARSPSSHLPLPWYLGATIDLPYLCRLGVWTAIMLSLSFTGVYAWRIAKEGRDLAQALAATELVLAREQHLSQLDGLAAAAAHELGTPARDHHAGGAGAQPHRPEAGPIAEDIRCCARRCSAAAASSPKFDHALQTGAGPWAVMSLRHLLEEVISPQRAFDVRIETRLDGIGPRALDASQPRHHSTVSAICSTTRSASPRRP